MIHTANWTLLTPALILGSGASAGAQSGSAKSKQVSEVQRLISSLEKREKALKSLRLKMTTSGSYPGDLRFSTSGTLRVLGTTHFHLEVRSSFDRVAKAICEVEKVITPDGVWTRQTGPVEDIYTVMSRDLMERLKDAQKAIAADRKENPMGLPGPLSNEGRAPLGSAMLKALDHQFELAVEKGTKMFDGVECRVISGKWRGFPDTEEIPNRPSESEPRGVQRVEIYLRTSDDVPIRMVQYSRVGKALEVTISKIEIDPKLEARQFVLEKPKGRKFMPVMKHAPSKAQIKRLLDEYEDLQKKK